MDTDLGGGQGSLSSLHMPHKLGVYLLLLQRDRFPTSLRLSAIDMLVGLTIG